MSARLLSSVVFAAASLSALTPRAAAAEVVSGTRSAELVERDHEIQLVLEHGVATLRVRRTVYNGGDRHDQALFFIDLPHAAVATGLRTKGTLRGREHWFEGKLLEAELAAERYHELTGIGGYYPKDPALLTWRDPSLLSLQVFPVAPESDKTVEYTLLLPTYYDAGRDHVGLPPLGTEQHPARVTLRVSHPRDQLFVDGEPVANGARITLRADHTIALARHAAPRIDASLASVSFADHRVLMHYQVALAPTISTVPRDARVVVIIDGSRSLSEGDRGAARSAAEAYLRRFAGPHGSSRAEVLVFDHEVKARHGRLVPVRKALADLSHLDLPEANGSRVDQALHRAGDLLAAGPKGARRILLLTDARTRDGLKTARLQALAERSGAIVHVGIVTEGLPLLERDDQHPWSEVARATGGVVWSVAARADDSHADEGIFEELARPVRIDHLRVMVPPLDDPPRPVPERLDEGRGLEALAIVDHPVDHLRIEGELWSEPVHETALVDEHQGRRWAALVFGSELLDELSEAEMMPLALLGGAVSPVTSYLAIEPGVRPSTEGLTEDEGGLGWLGIGSGGGGSGMGTIGMGSVGMLGADMRQQVLDQALAEALDACGGEGLAATVELQTTFVEIVEIDAVDVPAAADPSLEVCVERSMWALMLGGIFDDDLRSWTIDLPAS